MSHKFKLAQRFLADRGIPFVTKGNRIRTAYDQASFSRSKKSGESWIFRLHGTAIHVHDTLEAARRLASTRIAIVVQNVCSTEVTVDMFDGKAWSTSYNVPYEVAYPFAHGQATLSELLRWIVPRDCWETWRLTDRPFIMPTEKVPDHWPSQVHETHARIMGSGVPCQVRYFVPSDCFALETPYATVTVDRNGYFVNCRNVEEAVRKAATMKTDVKFGMAMIGVASNMMLNVSAVAISTRGQSGIRTPNRISLVTSHDLARSFSLGQATLGMLLDNIQENSPTAEATELASLLARNPTPFSDTIKKGSDDE